MPLITITDCRKIEDYKHAVQHTGAGERIIGASMSIADALNGADGLLLTGGDDVAPSRYGETPHATVVQVAPERDEFEIGLIHEARRRQARHGSDDSDGAGRVTSCHQATGHQWRRVLQCQLGASL